MPSITFTVSAAHASRMAAAYGTILGLKRDATLEEIKEHLRAQIVGAVKRTEQATAVAAVSEPAEIAVT